MFSFGSWSLRAYGLWSSEIHVHCFLGDHGHYELMVPGLLWLMSLGLGLNVFSSS